MRAYIQALVDVCVFAIARKPSVKQIAPSNGAAQVSGCKAVGKTHCTARCQS